MLVCVVVAGLAASARGSSAPSKLRAWGIEPGTLSRATPHIARSAGTKMLVVKARNFTTTGIDNPPSGTSQGDEAVGAGQLFSKQRPAGSLQFQEVLTSATPGRLVLTFTALLASGQITGSAVVRINNSTQPVTAAILGGTGAYAQIRGVMYATSAGNSTKLTFVYTTT